MPDMVDTEWAKYTRYGHTGLAQLTKVDIEDEFSSVKNNIMMSML